MAKREGFFGISTKVAFICSACMSIPDPRISALYSFPFFSSQNQLDTPQDDLRFRLQMQMCNEMIRFIAAHNLAIIKLITLIEAG